RDWSSDVCSSDLFIGHSCAQRFKSFNMLVNWARPQIASTWQADHSLPKFTQHNSPKIIGCTQLLHFAVWNRDRDNGRGVNVDSMVRFLPNVCTNIF